MAALERVGPYRIIDRLGAGGMGEVYLAEQKEPFRRKVAVKIVRAGYDSAQILARFESERQALALMDHPNIARVFEAGTTEDGRPYFAMEYVKGEAITSYCDRVRMTMRERARLMIQVCDAIQHAHQRAVIHRDVKPSNVLVAETDQGPMPKVIDFGVAKAMAQPLTERTLLTEFGQILGTPEYMSPEQADTSTDRVDTRTDVYSLGVLFYELLVGALPFDPGELRRAGVAEVLRKLREDEPRRPSTRVSTLGSDSATAAQRRRTTPHRMTSLLRGDLDWIVMKALEKDPPRRYGSPSDLARDIERSLEGLPVLAGPPSLGYRTRKFVLRHRFGVSFASVIVLLLLTLSVSTSVQARRVAQERDRAEREAETARRVSSFLSDVFEGADPDVSGGRVLTARELLDHGAAGIDELAGQPDVQNELRRVMARVYLMLGEFEVAEPLIQAALAHEESRAERNPRGLAASLELSAMLLDAGHSRPEAAEAAARRAVDLWDALGETHAKGECLNTLATTLWHQGRLTEASVRFEESIAIEEREHGKDSLAVTSALSNLGSVHLTDGDYSKAEEIYQRVVAIEAQQVDAERDYGHATTLHLLALVYEGLGRFEEAIESGEHSLAIREAVLGPDHWHVSLSLTTLGNLFRVTGRAAEAVPLQERAVAIARKTWDDSPDLWFAIRSLARTQIAVGEYEAAEAALLAERARRLDEDCAECMAEIVELLWESAHGRGDGPAAEERYQQARDVLAQVRPPAFEQLARATRAFESALREAGESERAEEISALRAQWSADTSP